MENTFSKFNIQIQDELDKYRKTSTVLFQYLQERAKTGFTKSQFEVYRDNYFFRTYQTVVCVAKVVMSAALNADYTTLSSSGKNCYEETGSGVPKKTHPELLLNSHNIHAVRIFGINKISLIDSLQSPNILDKTRAFTKSQMSLYDSKNHIEVLAANYAQEEAATQMLKTFLDCFFEPYRHQYPRKEYEEITEYFTCHLDGLEERHADDAKYCLFQRCKSSDDIGTAVSSISKILSAQGEMWVELQGKLSSLEG